MKMRVTGKKCLKYKKGTNFRKQNFFVVYGFSVLVT